MCAVKTSERKSASMVAVLLAVQSGVQCMKGGGVSGAESIEVVFDPQSDTEKTYDKLCFFAETADFDSESKELFKFSGSFASGWSRGITEPPSMIAGKLTWICEADHFAWRFSSDGSNQNWGYKFTCTPQYRVRVCAGAVGGGGFSLPVHCRTMAQHCMLQAEPGI